MSINQSNLSSNQYGYGLVVSTTQGSINAAMKEFLQAGSEPEVAICYVADNNGLPVLIDYAALKQAANGSDPFTIPDGADPNENKDVQNLYKQRFMVGFKARIGLPPGYAPTAIPDIVDLSGGVASVSYNLTCSEFIVTQYTPAGGYNAASWMNKSQPPGAAWIFNSRVNMLMSPTSDFSKLPPAVQAQIQDLGGETFSVQQLLFDLDNAALESMPTIENVDKSSPLYMVLQRDFLGQYFGTLKKNGQPVLGCAIAQQSSPSSLTVSNLDFQVSPLLSASGGPIPNPTKDQLDLTTINYLCAVNGGALPNPAHFTWNWVEVADAMNCDGSMAVNRLDFAGYLYSQLSEQAKSNCYLPVVKATLTSLGIDFVCHLGDTVYPEVVTYPTTGETVLSLSHTASASDQGGYKGDVGAVTLTPNFSLDVTCKGNQIVFTQRLWVYMYIKSLATSTDGNIVDRTITDTYSISVNQDGRLVATLASSTPVDKSQTIDVGSFVNWFVDINDTIDKVTAQTRAISAVHLQDISVSVIQGFVFPGGKTFIFKDGCFSDYQDLVARITYVDPS